jgi:hypothetical protein
MTIVAGTRSCRVHTWERRLEEHGGVECVVRFCRHCSRKELCWSRRPLSRSDTVAVECEGDPRHGLASTEEN